MAPGGPLQPGFQEGLRLFNQGRFWHAHEAWEDHWNQVRGQGASKATQSEYAAFVQGLIQAAAGLVKLQEGNARGARLNLQKALAKLEPIREEYGVHAYELRLRARAILQCLADGRLQDARALVPRLHVWEPGDR